MTTLKVRGINNLTTKTPVYKFKVKISVNSLKQCRIPPGPVLVSHAPPSIYDTEPPPLQSTAR